MRAAAGIVTGLAGHTAAAALGLSAILAARPDVLTAIRLAGAAYLVWLGVHALRAALVRDTDAASARVRSPHPYLDGLAGNLLNPKALLFYNDYNIDAFGDRGPLDKTEFVYQMVRSLRAQGVPVDGVGSQAHLSTRYGNYSPLQIADALNRFADLGVATAPTEVDVRNLLPETQTGDTMNPLLQAQAYNYSALLQGCLQSRHCLSFTVWGFTDRHSWVPGWFTNPPEGMANIYDENYQPKRAYNTLRADLAYAGPPAVQPRARHGNR